MSHEMAPPQPTPDELAQRLLEAHANTEIQFHGKTMAFGQFVQLRAALCPVKPGELGAASDTEFMVNVLVDSKVELTEEYHPYIRQPEIEKSKSHAADTGPIKKNNVLPQKASYKKTESEAVESKPKQNTQHKNESEVYTTPKLHPEIMARVVQLDVKPEVIKPGRNHIKTVSVIDKPTVLISPNTSHADRSNVIMPDVINTVPNKETYSMANQTLETVTEQLDTATPAVLPEAEDIEQINVFLQELLAVPVVEADLDTSAVNYEQVAVEADDITDIAFENNIIDMPEQSEAYEEVEKTPAVVVAEFMLQVLPVITQEVYVRVQEMEPEAAAEVAAQIETISIVADRLHELVVQGKTESEEAQQIEAYLKREYEQLLVAVGIEPSEEILNDFIRYIYSAEYQIREDINLKELEFIDEGTHEMKLFDEQGVFSRAHAASVNLSRRLDKSIGRLVVNYLNP